MQSSYQQFYNVLYCGSYHLTWVKLSCSLSYLSYRPMQRYTSIIHVKQSIYLFIYLSIFWCLFYLRECPQQKDLLYSSRFSSHISLLSLSFNSLSLSSSLLYSVQPSHSLSHFLSTASHFPCVYSFIKKYMDTLFTSLSSVCLSRQG